MLFKNTGEPQAAICFKSGSENRGFLNFKRARRVTKGIIAISAHADKDIESARAEPATSIFKTKRNTLISPTVKKFEIMFKTILILT